MEHWWSALMLQHGELTTIISLGQTNIDVEKKTPFVDHLPRKPRFSASMLFMLLFTLDIIIVFLDHYYTMMIVLLIIFDYTG